MEKGLKPNFNANDQEIICSKCGRITDQIGSNPYTEDDYQCPKCFDGEKEYREYKEWMKDREEYQNRGD